MSTHSVAAEDAASWRHCQNLVTQSGQEAGVIRVFLIRHGESESNAGLPSADPGSAPLTPDGHRQASQIARVLADVPALIVTSPYLQARQTAQPAISRFPQPRARKRPPCPPGQLHPFTGPPP